MERMTRIEEETVRSKEEMVDIEGEIDGLKAETARLEESMGNLRGKVENLEKMMK
ncbi:hypothetical protein C0995_003966, partial [Termitomyces sp. Mi166